MNFDLTEDQIMIQQAARDFAERVIEPVAYELDETQKFPEDIVKQMAENGFLGIGIPEEFGGAGLDTVSYALAMEEISSKCASCGVIMSVNNSLACDPLNFAGNTDQKKEYLTPMAQGQFLGCFGLTEPQAGSDAAAQKTTAVKDGDYYVINGSKNWITNGPQAKIMVLFAMTKPELGNYGISSFILDLDSPGVDRAPKEKKMGIRASGACSIHFEDVRIHKSLMLGEEGQGFKIAMKTLDGGRIGIAAQALGIAKASLDKAAAYSLEREAFGKPISKLQAIQFKLADMKTRYEAARLLTLRAAFNKDKKVRHSIDSAMAKVFASEAATALSHEAIQIFGGNGYNPEYHVERFYRDARITEIYEGTSEIQRLVIAGNLLKEFMQKNG